MPEVVTQVMEVYINRHGMDVFVFLVANDVPLAVIATTCLAYLY